MVGGAVTHPAATPEPPGHGPPEARPRSGLQGLDARLLTDHHARRLAELDIHRVRLAWDHTRDEQAIHDAIQRLRRAGITKHAIGVYVLVGFDDTPDDAIYRCDTLKRKWGIDPRPMRYQPLDTIKKNSYHRDVPTHHLAETLGDRQSQPGAPVPGRGRGISLRKRLEQPRYLLRRHADAGVAHAESAGYKGSHLTRENTGLLTSPQTPRLADAPGSFVWYTCANVEPV